MGRDRLGSFLHKLMFDLHMRAGVDILSTERISVYIFFMSSEQLSQSNFETLINDLKESSLNYFLKIRNICSFTNRNFLLLHTNYKFLHIGAYTEHFQASKTEYFAKLLLLSEGCWLFLQRVSS